MKCESIALMTPPWEMSVLKIKKKRMCGTDFSNTSFHIFHKIECGTIMPSTGYNYITYYYILSPVSHVILLMC